MNYPKRRSVFSISALLAIILSFIIIPTLSIADNGNIQLQPSNKHLTIKDKSKTLQQADPHLFKIPKLEIKLLSGDFEKYGNHWTDHSPELLTFRWTHEIEGFNVVAYQVRKLGQSADSPPLAHGALDHVPDKGKHSVFKIDFKPIVGNDSGRPLNYFVKLRFSFVNLADKSVKKIVDSNEVQVTIVKGVAGQSISLPKLRVTINKIEILDDSDDLSDGEFGFAFWLQYSGGNKTAYQYFNGSAGTGENLHPNLTMTLENPPQWVTIRAYGFDDDEVEWIPIGPFIILLAQKCGSLADPESSSGDCPSDSAAANLLVDSGSGSGVQKPKQPFSFYALGGSLKFKVHGSYELTPN